MSDQAKLDARYWPEPAAVMSRVRLSKGRLAKNFLESRMLKLMGDKG